MSSFLRILTFLILITTTGPQYLYSINSIDNFTPFSKRSDKNDKKEKKDRTTILKKLRLFKSSIYKNQDLKDFNYHLKIYVINADIEKVWSTYTNSKPNEVWHGPLGTYKHSYSTKEDKIYLSNDSILPVIELDMVYEINLKIAKILNVGVAFKITDLNHENKVIEFTYGEENKSHGRQKIIFSEFKGKTYIFHSSNFKSENKIRDKYLYPKFHEVCMDEFHNNMINKIMNTKKEEYIQTSYLFDKK